MARQGVLCHDVLDAVSIRQHNSAASNIVAFLVRGGDVAIIRLRPLKADAAMGVLVLYRLICEIKRRIAVQLSCKTDQVLFDVKVIIV